MGHPAERDRRYAGYDAERVTQRSAGEAAGRLAVVEFQQF
jgi:hypothetical protein